MLGQHTRVAVCCSTVCVIHIVSFVEHHHDLSACDWIFGRRHLWTLGHDAYQRRGAASFTWACLASHFFMLIGLWASHSPRKLFDEDNQTCSESSLEPPPHSELAPTFIAVVALVRVAAGTTDTADITAAVVVTAGAARTLDHADLVVGPRYWPIDSTRRVSRNKS
jgi:hypothetical protein